MHRYYCPSPLEIGGRITLEGDQVHHLLRVMRGQVGDQIRLFNGQGGECVAEITETSRKSAVVKVLECSDTNRELERDVTVACALPKGDRQRFLVEKLVELGARTLIPLQTERSVVKPNESACARLRKAVIEASKQCGRNHLMVVHDGHSWQRLLERFAADGLEPGRPIARLIAHPYPPASPWTDRLDATTPVVFAVGPEGGFTNDEVQAAAARDWQAVDLGPRLLRVETAAVAVMAGLSLGFGIGDRIWDRKI